MEKILLVDDEQSVRDLCASMLQSAGYQVETAANGGEALIRCGERAYDLLVTDIKMPDMDGLSLIDRVRDIYPEMLTIVMTGYGTMDHALGAIRRGVHAFILKPFARGEFLTTVSDVLNKHRISRLQSRVKFLLPLFDLSQTLLSERDLSHLLQTVVGMVVKETRADTASVMLLDEPSGILTIRAAHGLSDEIVRTTKRRLGEKIAGWVAQMGEPLYLRASVNDDPDLKAAMVRADVSEAMCFPLLYKRRVIGVLNLNKAPGTVSFNESDIELSTVLAGQAAIAIANVGLFEEVRRKTMDLAAANFDTIKALAEALETKDAYTRGHADRALTHAVAVARRMGLGAEETERLKYAAILHDIGKIGIPDAILNKPAPLTEEEYAEMKTHPEKGAEIIRQIKFLSSVVPLVLHHQECYDGSGYPKGLRGDEIPIESRIVAVLDAYDAMTSDRIYRPSPGKKYAKSELQRCAGTQFDPKVVEAFIEVVTEEESSQADR